MLVIEMCEYPTPDTGRGHCHNPTDGGWCRLHQRVLAKRFVDGEAKRPQDPIKSMSDELACRREWLKRFRNELARTASLHCRRWLEAKVVDGCKALEGNFPSQWCSRCRAIRILDQEKRGMFT